MFRKCSLLMYKVNSSTVTNKALCQCSVLCSEEQRQNEVKLTKTQISNLEKLSALKLKDSAEVSALQEDIQLANQVFEVETEDHFVKIFCRDFFAEQGIFSPSAYSNFSATTHSLRITIDASSALTLRPYDATTKKSNNLMASKERSNLGRTRDVGPWTEQTSSTGKKYYYNHETEVSQWDKPDVWKEWERKLVEEKTSHVFVKSNGNGHAVDSVINSRASTSHILSKNVSSTSSSPFNVAHTSTHPLNGQSVNSYAKVREFVATKEDQPPLKRPHLEAQESTDKFKKCQSLNSQQPLPATSIPPLNMSVPPPVSTSFFVPIHLDPPPPMPIMMDEPMDVVDSPPPQEVKTELPIEMLKVDPFNETPYIRFYKSNLSTPLRKSLISETTLGEIRKNQDKLQKSTLQLMELETSIISVQSLLCTAQTKSLLLREKYGFLAEQLDAIKKQHAKCTFSEEVGSQKDHQVIHPSLTCQDTPTSPVKESLDGFDQLMNGLEERREVMEQTPFPLKTGLLDVSTLQGPSHLQPNGSTLSHS